MKYLINLILISSLTLFSLPKVPEDFTPEDLRELPDEALEFLLDELKDSDEEAVGIESFFAESEFETSEGFLTIHKDLEDNAYFLELNNDDLDQELIYFAYVMNGPQASGTEGGRIGRGSILEFRRHEDGIGLFKKNTYFENQTENNISKADLTNIIEAFLEKFDIEAEGDDRLIIEVTDLFKSEILTNISPNIPPEFREFVALNLGRLDEDKTTINQIRNYAKNTAVEVSYVFNNFGSTGNRTVYAVADPRFASITGRHLFVEMPDDNFEPRVSDQRVGYFSQRVTDMSTYDNYPARDLVNKWRLVKKDPEADISEPVEPIVFWVEKSTPEEIKPMVVKGIEAWNLAFERAGFKNAIVAKIQADDAEWDAGDVQYNVVRWASFPEPSYSGYGPSIANPRTGELIAADIVQTFAAIKRGYNLRKLWGWTPENDPLEQWIIALTIHEVGHTIGLRHNFSASYLFGPKEVHDKSVTGNATISSIMDYDPINIAPPGLEQGMYFPIEPGEYDKWAVEFAYKPNLGDVEREQLLRLSVQDPYVYGPDEDAMGSPGTNIDPRAKRYDMSNDVVTYTADRFIILDQKISELPDIYSDEGETKQDMTSTFYSLVREKGRFMDAVSRQIGGVYVTKLVNGQDEFDAYDPVPYEKQKEAMELINTKFLANGAWDFDPEILRNLQREKRAAGSYRRDSNEDPQLHDMVIGMQGRVLAHILNPTVMTRLVDSSEYGNEYLPGEVLDDLFNGIFVKGETPDTYKRNLQSLYVDGLLEVFSDDSRYDELAKAAVFDSIMNIQKFTRSPVRDAETKKHFGFINWKLSKFLEE